VLYAFPKINLPEFVMNILIQCGVQIVDRYVLNVRVSIDFYKRMVAQPIRKQRAKKHNKSTVRYNTRGEPTESHYRADGPQ